VSLSTALAQASLTVDSGVWTAQLNCSMTLAELRAFVASSPVAAAPGTSRVAVTTGPTFRPALSAGGDAQTYCTVRAISVE
jgi:hypothetical protein